MKRMAEISNNPNAIDSKDCHDNKLCIRSLIFSVAYFPASTIIASLVNLPTKNGGTMLHGFIRAIPAAVKSGVVGMGINV